MMKGFTQDSRRILMILHFGIPSAKYIYQSLVPQAISDSKPGRSRGCLNITRFFSRSLAMTGKTERRKWHLLYSLHFIWKSSQQKTQSLVLLCYWNLQNTQYSDILDASNELAFFLARTVIDDVLAPLNLEEIATKL
ncbi:ma3 domain-containing translation regulatory factor 3 [Sesamum alatum]|uniref:Ma3 domain-containing translation regulatory factor 3 n=1 Tax=Sesamum alatum TaxID=300844 RepID=A0AAE1YB59_9LAMI|nr:ma3 domain-containing translation regulatory factor 3 [Sesamum alatum]